MGIFVIILHGCSTSKDLKTHTAVFPKIVVPDYRGFSTKELCVFFTFFHNGPNDILCMFVEDNSALHLSQIGIFK